MSTATDEMSFSFFMALTFGTEKKVETDGVLVQTLPNAWKCLKGRSSLTTR